jgi:hypothetical protein
MDKRLMGEFYGSATEFGFVFIFNELDGSRGGGSEPESPVELRMLTIAAGKGLRCAAVSVGGLRDVLLSDAATSAMLAGLSRAATPAVLPAG